MANTRSGKDTSKPTGVDKNTNARKTREEDEMAAQRRKIEDKRKQRQQELESLRKDLLAAESQLKGSQLTEDERDELQKKHNNFQQVIQSTEADIKKDDEDLMDIDTTEHAATGSNGQAPENGASSIQPQSVPQNTLSPSGDETSVKQEPVDASNGQGQGQHRKAALPDPDTAKASVEEPDLVGSPNPNEDNDGELLVRLNTFTKDGHSNGTADAWFMMLAAEKLIVRYGPKQACKYVIQSGKGHNSDGLPQVSDPESRLCSIMEKDKRGKNRRRYGPENIEGIVGVAILERPLNTKSSKAPTTYVKLNWTNIKEEDKHLCRDGTNWITRTDLIEITNEELATSKITEAWEKQEARYNNWEQGLPIGTPSRSPTPCPLDVWQRAKRERSCPVRGHSRDTMKREATASPAPDIMNAGSSDSSESQSGNPVRPIPEGATGAAIDPTTPSDKPASQITFSRKDYVERMTNSMALDKTDMQAYVKALAFIEAEYAVYKGHLLANGGVEVY
ncbi:uncharacterized protein AKAW2_50479S [Aspergillus luchuensis]|uniref:Uncharacterized protein n=1 Tax=Aspergillus kawachii TaxID=1069201 RepID=A0A7R7WBY7_ASPKA|nr:uncharacterized protein AKAW2_50479S [Aspergillus luchuensis]BCS00138.1 hypothetical protein AKAW2_50479S [Aspergillus luchuensis]GAA93161.1 hypothetical protein AKAW_11273 [Aspergillus luchuensis IFO 4308]